MSELITAALIKDGYSVFIAAGVKIDENDIPRLRCGANYQLVRRLSEPSWQIMRETLIKSIDKLRSAPLDDMTRVYEEE